MATGVLIPIAISSQFDKSGDERIHAAGYDPFVSYTKVEYNKFLTSLPYPQYDENYLTIGLFFEQAGTRGLYQTQEQPPEELELNLDFVEAATRPLYLTYNSTESLDLGLSFVSAETRPVYTIYSVKPEGLDFNLAFVSASTKRILITQSNPPESLDLGLAFVSASTFT